MSIPVGVRGELEAVLGSLRGEGEPVGGGCINPARRVETAAGPVFVKYNKGAATGLFEAEADGLRELAAAGSLRVPEVLGWGESWLALEWLEPGSRAPDFDERLGRGLAELHGARPAAGWGWHRDGFIGPLDQPNGRLASWADFWRTRRLEPQLRRARDAGADVGPPGDWDRLFAGLPAALDAAERDGRSLLHGDLWSGNVIATGVGEPAIVDPAAYHGHREVDLAMSELFGGFGSAFYSAYREARPLEPGYSEVRRGVYQLYYLLVHVNLFGGGYGARTRQVLQDVLSAS